MLHGIDYLQASNRQLRHSTLVLRGKAAANHSSHIWRITGDQVVHTSTYQSVMNLNSGMASTVKGARVGY